MQRRGFSARYPCTRERFFLCRHKKQGTITLSWCRLRLCRVVCSPLRRADMFSAYQPAMTLLFSGQLPLVSISTLNKRKVKAIAADNKKYREAGSISSQLPILLLEQPIVFIKDNSMRSQICKILFFVTSFYFI